MADLDDRKLVSLFSYFSQDYYKKVLEMKKAADWPSEPKWARVNEEFLAYLIIWPLEIFAYWKLGLSIFGFS